MNFCPVVLWRPMRPGLWTVQQQFLETGAVDTKSFGSTALYEGDEGFLLFVDLPGVLPVGVTIDAEPDRLILTARRLARPSPDGEAFFRREECFSGYWRKEIRFRAAIDPESATARLTDGVLQVFAKKAVRRRPVRVPVQGSGAG